MNHFYETIPGWFDFHDIYLDAIARAEAGAKFVEVGAWLGRSTAFMAVELLLSGKSIDFYAVDTWKGSPSEGAHRCVVDAVGGSVRAIFDENMRRGGVFEVVKIIEADSLLATAAFPDGSLDFVFIDADHSYEAMLADIDAWSPKVKPGGILAGHDHSEGFPGVVRAVRERLSRWDSEVQKRGNSWWFKKPESKYSIAVTTAARPDDYLSATMRHVLRGAGIAGGGWPVRLCVSSSCTDGIPTWLWEQVNLGRLCIEAAQRDAWNEVKDAGPHRRCCANTWQALALAPAGDVLLLQDDVDLSNAWPLHLRFRTGIATERYGSNWILALYAAYPFTGTHLAEYPCDLFYGNQALYFPAGVAAAFAAFLWNRGVKTYDYADDIALKEFARISGIPILASIPGLAQHVGFNTTGLGAFHSSPIFARDP